MYITGRGISWEWDPNIGILFTTAESPWYLHVSEKVHCWLAVLPGIINKSKEQLSTVWDFILPWYRRGTAIQHRQELVTLSNTAFNLLGTQEISVLSIRYVHIHMNMYQIHTYVDKYIFNTHNVNPGHINPWTFWLGRGNHIGHPRKARFHSSGLTSYQLYHIYPSNHALIFLEPTRCQNFASRISNFDPYQHRQDPTSNFLEQNAQNAAHLLHRDGHYASIVTCDPRMPMLGVAKWNTELKIQKFSGQK